MVQAHRLSAYWMDADRFMDWPGDGTGRTYQLVDGEPVAMALPGQTHARLQARLVYQIVRDLQARGSPCEALVGPGVRPRPDMAHNVRVPDVAVTCTPDSGRFVDQPVVIAEVLSPSNERETREAIRAVLAIPSLREVVVLGSEVVLIELLRRESGGEWPENALTFGAGQTVELESIGVMLSIDELYAGLGSM